MDVLQTPLNRRAVVKGQDKEVVALRSVHWLPFLLGVGHIIGIVVGLSSTCERQAIANVARVVSQPTSN